MDNCKRNVEFLPSSSLFSKMDYGLEGRGKGTGPDPNLGLKDKEVIKTRLLQMLSGALFEGEKVKVETVY